MQQYRDEDDGKTTDGTTIARALMARAAKKGETKEWIVACRDGDVEAKRRSAASPDSTDNRIAALNASPDALAMIAAAYQVGGINAKLIEADARVAYKGAGYSDAESVILACQKVKEVAAAKAKEMKRIAGLISARINGGAAPVLARAGAGAAAAAPALGTFARVNAKPTPKPVVKQVVIPPGMGSAQAIELARAGHLPLRAPVMRTDAVKVMAEKLQDEARASGHELSWEEATSEAFTRVHGRKAGAK